MGWEPAARAQQYRQRTVACTMCSGEEDLPCLRGFSEVLSKAWRYVVPPGSTPAPPSAEPFGTCGRSSGISSHSGAVIALTGFYLPSEGGWSSAVKSQTRVLSNSRTCCKTTFWFVFFLSHFPYASSDFTVWLRGLFVASQALPYFLTTELHPLDLLDKVVLPSKSFSQNLFLSKYRPSLAVP